MSSVCSNGEHFIFKAHQNTNHLCKDSVKQCLLMSLFTNCAETLETRAEYSYKMSQTCPWMALKIHSYM